MILYSFLRTLDMLPSTLDILPSTLDFVPSTLDPRPKPKLVKGLQCILNICFFALFIVEREKVSDSINIALSNVYGQHLTASHKRCNSKVFTKSCMSKPGLIIPRTNPRDTTLLAKVYVQSCFHGKRA